MYHFRKNKLLFFVSILFLISGFIFSSNLSALNIYKTGEFSLGFRVSRTPSTDVPAKINEALEILTPEAIAGVESQAKFIIHSGPSAVGQGTVKSTVVEKYSGENSGEIKFKKFLLYATRAKRGIKISEDDIRYGIVKKYVEMVETHKNPSNIEEIISVMTDKEQNEIEKFTAENKEKLKELEGALFPNWTKMLSVVSRNDIPKLEERIKFQTAEEGKTNMVMVYQEFDGVHYYFRDSVEEVKKEAAEKGIKIIIKPVRNYFQGLNVDELKKTFEKGVGEITILEGDRVWFDCIQDQGFKGVTSVFIAPINDEEFKNKMSKKMGDSYKEKIVNSDIEQLMVGGIENYIYKRYPELKTGISEDYEASQNEAVLNVRLAITASVGYLIVEGDIGLEKLDEWIKETKIVTEDNLEIVKENLGLSFNMSKIGKIAYEIFEEIKKDKLKICAFRIMIEEMKGRIMGRNKTEGRDMSKVEEGKIYARISQSPREYAGRLDYGETLVNTFGDKKLLDENADKFAWIMINNLLKSIEGQD